jgi:hypothetical protein
MLKCCCSVCPSFQGQETASLYKCNVRLMNPCEDVFLLKMLTLLSQLSNLWQWLATCQYSTWQCVSLIECYDCCKWYLSILNTYSHLHRILSKTIYVSTVRYCTYHHQIYHYSWHISSLIFCISEHVWFTQDFGGDTWKNKPSCKTLA